MIELEKNMNELLNELNQNWIKAIKASIETGEGIDLSDVFGQYSEVVQKKDQAFLEAAQRLGIKVDNKKKKGFFG